MTEQLRDWDIVSGIGITALAVAAGRAVETSRADGLIADPLAAAFVEAANAPVHVPTRYDEIPADDRVWNQVSHVVGLRSKFFDEYFVDATGPGVRQAVILAAGLDCRAFRLDWPGGTTVFEIDQPRVLEFKDRVLAEQGALPACDRRAVAADLRADWPAALADAGFDPARPTAWLAEGLLAYLPGDAASRLMDTIHGLSAPGSAVALEHVGDAQAAFENPDAAEIAEEFEIDVRPLLIGGPQTSPEEYLSALGWRMARRTLVELAQRYGRPLGDSSVVMFADNEYITGILTA